MVSTGGPTLTSTGTSHLQRTVVFAHQSLSGLSAYPIIDTGILLRYEPSIASPLPRDTAVVPRIVPWDAVDDEEVKVFPGGMVTMILHTPSEPRPKGWTVVSHLLKIPIRLTALAAGRRD